jgi:hypothetical protein
VSAQPAERDDLLDPQRILDDLPVDERRFFLDQYREALNAVRGPVSGGMSLEDAVRVYRPAP